MQATKGWWHKDETSVYLKIRGIANTHLLFDYVYGILAKSGVGDRAHNLAHMMASGLCDKAEVNLDLGFGVDGGRGALARLRSAESHPVLRTRRPRTASRAPARRSTADSLGCRARRRSLAT